MLGADRAAVETFGLLATFAGIGLIVTVILVYVAIQVRGERLQNERYRAERQQRFGSPQ
jgi:hypothetical protein